MAQTTVNLFLFFFCCLSPSAILANWETVVINQQILEPCGVIEQAIPIPLISDPDEDLIDEMVAQPVCLLFEPFRPETVIEPTEIVLDERISNLESVARPAAEFKRAAQAGKSKERDVLQQAPGHRSVLFGFIIAQAKRCQVQIGQLVLKYDSVQLALDSIRSWGEIVEFEVVESQGTDFEVSNPSPIQPFTILLRIAVSSQFEFGWERSSRWQLQKPIVPWHIHDVKSLRMVFEFIQEREQVRIAREVEIRSNLADQVDKVASMLQGLANSIRPSERVRLSNETRESTAVH